MRIKRVECDQFAGITSKEFEFDNGLNLVIGDNESGKSTMVDLIYQMLFKDSKLSGKSDAAFIDKYFPKKVSGIAGDAIDGVLVFVTSEGTYKLKKEWDKGEGSCSLVLPDGTKIKNIDTINEILAKELKHRAGVYSEIMFASQKRNQLAIESIMKTLGKKDESLSETRADLTSTLSKAALETGGVSIEKIEKTLILKMTSLSGHWDFVANAPEGGAKRSSYKNAWQKEVGSITKAYYEVDEISSMQADAEAAERSVESEKDCISAIKFKRDAAKAEREKFKKFSGMLMQIALIDSAIENLTSSITEQERVLANWPGIIANIEKAKKLQSRYKHAQTREFYNRVLVAQKNYSVKKEAFDALVEVDPDDIKKLSKLLASLQSEEGKLLGMNIVAKIKQLGSTPINVNSSATGDSLTIDDGELEITEAVDILVPGVMQMQLMPRGVDVDEVKSKIASLKADIDAIYTKYGVDNLSDLQEKSTNYIHAKNEAEVAKKQLDATLGDTDWNELKVANDMVPSDIETETVIKQQIAEFCGSRSVDAFIGGLEATLESYTSKYESIEKLTAAIEANKADREAQQQKLDSMGAIPEEYQGINAESYDADLAEKIEAYESQLEAHNESLREAERKLGDKTADEYADELQKKKAVLDAKITEYKHWNNIYQAFVSLKDQSSGNPVEDIETKFAEYLSIITDGKLALREKMDEQMSAKLASGNHSLEYGILSDGTKDTISLAFRLAMLDHLYPDGDGIAVFDDPFTDMDPTRMGQACKLIQKFAEKNQVIFITCDDKYKDILGGNVIQISA